MFRNNFLAAKLDGSCNFMVAKFGGSGNFMAAKLGGSGNFMAAKLGGLNIVRPKQEKGQNAKKSAFRPATGRNTLESA